MRYCFIMASLSTRTHLLNKFIDSAKKSKYKDADYYLYFQNITGEEPNFDTSFFKDIKYSATRDGVFYPRAYWLHNLDDYDFYIIIDDDMEFLGKENFEEMMDFASHFPHCGLVCGEYKNRLDLYEKAEKKNDFKEQNIQFLEGGGIIKKEIRDLFCKVIPFEKLSYDAFCIVTYINGYTNYKCYSSIVLHKLTNGNQGFVYVKRHSSEYKEWFEKYIKQTHYEHNGELRLPLKESDLTDEAIMLHNKNLK